MKKYLDSDKFWWILLAVLIILQSVVLSVKFTQKKDFHSDELWNYGFANSSDGMHIYKNDGTWDVRYFNEWVDASVLKEYLTVSTDEIFDYSATYTNAMNDINPFLGYFMLHFICSFFPGVFSPWFCFVLNLMCLAVTEIFIFKLLKGSTKSKVIALIACAFLGFSSGMRDVTFFLRIYAPAAMFTTMMTYYMALIFQKRDEQVKKSVYIKLLLSALAGFLTVHQVLFVAFAMTVAYCLYYLCTKRFKKFWAFGFTMLGAVVLSIAIFPITFTHFFGDGYAETVTDGALPFELQFKAYFVYITNDFFGIHTSAWHTMTLPYIGYTLIVLVFFLIPICFILRNETFFKNFLKKMRDGIISLWHRKSNFQFDIIAMILGLLVLFVICGWKTSIYYMGRPSSRYIFIVYPMFVAILAETLGHIFLLIFKGKPKIPAIILAVLAVVFTILNNALSLNTFLFASETDGMQAREIEENANVIVMMDDVVRMTNICAKLQHINKYFYVSYDSAFDQNYSLLEDMDKDAPLYVIIDEESLIDLDKLEFDNQQDEDNFWNIYNNTKIYRDREKYIKFFKNLPIAEKFEYRGIDTFFGRAMTIYRLN